MHYLLQTVYPDMFNQCENLQYFHDAMDSLEANPDKFNDEDYLKEADRLRRGKLRLESDMKEHLIRCYFQNVEPEFDFDAWLAQNMQQPIGASSLVQNDDSQ